MKVADIPLNIIEKSINDDRLANILLGRKKSNCTNTEIETFMKNKKREKISSFKYDYKEITNSKNKKNRNVKCDVCREKSYKSPNIIIKCNLCFNAVHLKCYGSGIGIEKETPETTPWYCERCTYLSSKNYNSYHIRCYFCPNVKGIIKRIGRDIWAHISCVLWTEDVCYFDDSKREKVDLTRIDSKRFGICCYLCNHKLGACMKCAFNECEMMFHVKCAQNNKLIKKSSKMKRYMANGVIQVFCHKHKEEFDTSLGLYKSLKGKTELRLKELDQLSDQFSNRNSEENSSFTFNECSKKISRSSRVETPNLIDLTRNENQNHVEKKIAKMDNKFCSYFKINKHSFLTKDEITAIFLKHCSDNNIIDSDSGYILLFRDKVLRDLFDRDFIRPNEIQQVLENCFIVSYCTEGEMKGEEKLKTISLHQNKTITERDFFTKSSILHNFKL